MLTMVERKNGLVLFKTRVNVLGLKEHFLRGIKPWSDIHHIVLFCLLRLFVCFL